MYRAAIHTSIQTKPQTVMAVSGLQVKFKDKYAHFLLNKVYKTSQYGEWRGSVVNCSYCSVTAFISF